MRQDYRYGGVAMHVLMISRWDHALEFLLSRRTHVDNLPARFYEFKWGDDLKRNNRAIQRTVIFDLVDELFQLQQVDMAVAWLLLAADPAVPETVQPVVPAVEALLDRALDDDDVSHENARTVRKRLKHWYAAAGGELRQASRSIFAVAAGQSLLDQQTDDIDHDDEAEFDRESELRAIRSYLDASGLVVLPSVKDRPLSTYNGAVRSIVGERLPFRMAPEVQPLRGVLRREYPHAMAAVESLLRNLRPGKPVYMKPVVLVGTPGSGKSRLARRLAELLQTPMYRFSMSGANDSMFAGTPKAWSNSLPSVPARAIAQFRVANPMMLLDEIDKAGSGNYNGSPVDALLPFLERETAKRTRDVSIDADIDLSHISYIATANTLDEIPAPLRDRFKVIRVPEPNVEHLPALVASILASMAAEEDVDVAFLEPLSQDELEVIADVWRTRRSRSVRALQKMVSATLEAREQHARRH